MQKCLMDVEGEPAHSFWEPFATCPDTSIFFLKNLWQPSILQTSTYVSLKSVKYISASAPTIQTILHRAQG